MTKNKITAVIIDDREPSHITSLKFGGVPVLVKRLDVGDLHVMTSDGNVLVIERKTPADFLSSLADGRLWQQCANMVDARVFGGHWCYVLITGTLENSNGHVKTAHGETNWMWNSVQGALTSVQELGIYTHTCDGDQAFEQAVIRLAQRSRGAVTIIPQRAPQTLGKEAQVLSTFSGIGPKRAMELLGLTYNNLGKTLQLLTDLDIDLPIPKNVRTAARSTLGLGETGHIFVED
jgi:ERCC4-type nuclease